MPIYAYRCAACGFAKDVLQKMSDAALTDCPACHQSSFKKQVTAAGFQLKGSGWYQTDFRDGGKSPAKSTGDKSEAKSTDSGGSSGGSTSGDTPAASAAASCAPGCACH